MIFIFKLEKVFAPYRFYMLKSENELEVTVVMVLVKILNLIEKDDYEKYISFGDKFIYFLFNSILILNITSYLILTLTLIFFNFFMCVYNIRNENRLNINRGLTQEELNQL
jgi:hypothetical protein